MNKFLVIILISALLVIGSEARNGGGNRPNRPNRPTGDDGTSRRPHHTRPTRTSTTSTIVINLTATSPEIPTFTFPQRK